MQRRFVCALAVVAFGAKAVFCAGGRQGRPQEPLATDDRLVFAGRVPRSAVRRPAIQQLRQGQRSARLGELVRERGPRLHALRRRPQRGDPVLQARPKAGQAGRPFRRRLARGDFADAQAGRWVCLGLRDGSRRECRRRQSSAGLHRPVGDRHGPARTRTGRDGWPRLRRQYLVGQPERRGQNPHLSRRSRETGDRGVAARHCWEASGKRRSTARRRHRFPIRSRASVLAASTFISRSPTPGTAKSRSTGKTFITTSITGRTRRERKSRRSSSKIWRDCRRKSTALSKACA